jgi:hypothetical protein
MKPGPGRILCLMSSWLLLTVGWSGCAFVESAAEITVGAPELPPIAIDVVLTYSQVNQSIMEGLSPQAKQVLEAAGLKLKTTSTWLDLRNTLCTLTEKEILEAPRIEIGLDTPEGANNISSLVLLLEVITSSGESCKEATLASSAVLDFIPFTHAQAEKMNEQLNTDLASLKDAIKQIRFLFSRAEFVRMVNGKSEAANHVLTDFQLLLASPTVSDDPATPFNESAFELVPFFLLETISAETPQRFELDPDSPITDEVKERIANPPLHATNISLQVQANLTLALDVLGGTALNGSGVKIDLQPEIVINALTVIAESL